MTLMHAAALVPALSATSVFGWPAAVAVLAEFFARRGNVSALLNHVRRVVGVGPEKEMRGIHACPHVASVKYAEAVGNRPEMQLPRKAMGQARVPLVIQPTVAASVRGCRPQPAVILAVALRNMCHQAIDRRCARPRHTLWHSPNIRDLSSSREWPYGV